MEGNCCRFGNLKKVEILKQFEFQLFEKKIGDEKIGLR